MNTEKHTIVPGEGVGACRIGANKQAAIATFGLPSPADPDSEVSGYLEFRSAGVEVAFDENDRIVTIFIHFRSPSHAPFRGTTGLGIGIDSTVEDVLAAYGQPSRVLNFSERTIAYAATGIEFTFKDDLLVDIRISEPVIDPWPQEWPVRPITDDLSWIAFSGGGDWVQPVLHAQASFLEFARVAELERFRLLPAYEAIAIKAFFESMPGNPMFGEHIYLTDIYTNGTTITAKLDASSFRRADLKEGQEVTFSIGKLSDWFLVRTGRGVGGFTIAMVWDQLSEEEQAQAKQSPPFIWFSHRQNQTAEDDLITIPQCVKCKRRCLLMGLDYKDGICGICQNAGRRCDCPKCGAPLIRYDKMPDLCTRCLSQANAQQRKSWWQFWK